MNDNWLNVPGRVGSVQEEIETLQAAVDRMIPIREGLTVLVAEVAEDLDALYPEERALIENAVPRRQQEFATARRLARAAMTELEIEAGPILRGAQREPVWPESVVGSLTHAENCAAACVARRRSVRSVGIDIEIADRVGENLHEKLFTAKERDFLANRQLEYAGLLFSAKEAVYKAVFPIVGRFIGFREAELAVDESTGRIRFSYIGDHAPNQVMETAECWYLFSGRYVLSLVVIS